jgi:D-glycero-D-manno-heptose 1,7-bisphosphate phosphatase
MSKAVFLDRDGVINEIVYFPEIGMPDSPLNPRQFKLLPGVAEAIRIFNSLGLKVIVASNQPAIAKGKMTPELFEQIRIKMRTALEKKGARIDGEYYCLHHPQAKLVEYKVNCNCRKPKPGLILRASEDFGLELTQCYAIGDSLTDVEAGKAVGCMTFLIGNSKCDLCKLLEEKNVKPDYIVPSLLHASRIIGRMRNGNIP